MRNVAIGVIIGVTISLKVMGDIGLSYMAWNRLLWLTQHPKVQLLLR